MPAVRKQAEATMTHCCGALAQRCRLAPWSLRSRRRWSLPSMWRGDPRLPARRPAARRPAAAAGDPSHRRGQARAVLPFYGSVLPFAGIHEDPWHNGSHVSY